MRYADTNLTQHYDDDEHHWQAMREAVESLPMLKYETPEQRKAETERPHDALEIMSEYGRELKS